MGILKKLNFLMTRKQKRSAVGVFCLVLLSGLTETMFLALVFSFAQAISSTESITKSSIYSFLEKNGIISTPSDYLFWISITLGIFCIFKGIIAFLASFNNFRFSNNLFFELSNKIYTGYVYSKYEDIIQSNSADVIRCVTTDTQNTYVLIKSLVDMTQEIVIVLLASAYLVMKSPTITLSLFCFLFVLFILIRKFISRPLANFSQTRLNFLTDFIKLMNQSSGAIKEIKINHVENEFQKNFSDTAHNVASTTVKTDTLGCLPKILLENTSMLAIFVMIGLLGTHGTNMDYLLPLLATFAMAAYKIVPGFSRIATYYTQIIQNSPSLDHVLSFVENKTSELVPVIDKSAKEDGVEIDINNMSYQFEDADSPLLDHIDFHIDKFSSVGIVGETGSGKTTFADLILGLRAPTSGNILANGKNIHEYPVWWGRQVGYVSQTFYMLDDTIKNNVLFQMDYDENKLIKVLKMAMIWDFVNSLPKGWDTSVGESGVRLSGGQRQRLGIARALYRDPRFLVLDEATSALDNETERAVVETVDSLRGKLTVMIIAHRLTTIEKCDHVYRVENQKVMEVR